MARRPERNFFEQIKRNLPKCGYRLDLQRVENTAGTGTPDLNYCLEDREGWAELKAWERVRFSGRFTVPKLREDQAVWLSRRARVGGRAWLLCRVNKDVVLLDGRLAPALFDKNKHQAWLDAKLHVADLWLEHPVDWKELARILMGRPAGGALIEQRLSYFTERKVAETSQDM